MSARYIAVIAMYLCAAAATVGCAWAWGPEGRSVVAVITVTTFLFAAVGAVQLDRPSAAPTTPKEG